jgi:hypothetical protein
MEERDAMLESISNNLPMCSFRICLSPMRSDRLKPYDMRLRPLRLHPLRPLKNLAIFSIPRCLQ